MEMAKTVRCSLSSNSGDMNFGGTETHSEKK